MNRSKERKLNRHKGYNYSQNGRYFVTIATKDREHWFGEVVDNKIVLDRYGKIAHTLWLEIPDHFPHMKIDEFIVMPNHIHGILIVDWDDVGNNNYCSLQVNDDDNKIPWQKKWKKTISSSIRGFKIGVTKTIRQEFNNYEFGWQKSFHDRIIRNEQEYSKIKNYIINNPVNWYEDILS